MWRPRPESRRDACGCLGGRAWCLVCEGTGALMGCLTSNTCGCLGGQSMASGWPREWCTDERLYQEAQELTAGLSVPLRHKQRAPPLAPRASTSRALAAPPPTSTVSVCTIVLFPNVSLSCMGIETTDCNIGHGREHKTGASPSAPHAALFCYRVYLQYNDVGI